MQAGSWTKSLWKICKTSVFTSFLATDGWLKIKKINSCHVTWSVLEQRQVKASVALSGLHLGCCHVPVVNKHSSINTGSIIDIDSKLHQITSYKYKGHLAFLTYLDNKWYSTLTLHRGLLAYIEDEVLQNWPMVRVARCFSAVPTLMCSLLRPAAFYYLHLMQNKLWSIHGPNATQDYPFYIAQHMNMKRCY